MKSPIHFAWYDFWIGWYYNQKKRILYICPLPMVVIEIKIKNRRDHVKSTQTPES